MLHECAQQLLDAEIADRRTEEHRRLPAGAVGGLIEGRGRAAYQLDFRAVRRGVCAQQLLRLRRVETLDHAIVADAAALASLVDVDAVLEQVVDALQLAPHADRPGHGRRVDAQHRLDLIEQLDRRAAIAIELVDEGHDRRVAQPAHLHQLHGALLDTLGAVDDHERGIDRGQRAIGVFREILVTRRVQQVDDAVAIRELHHRTGDRDAALLLEPHPVRGRVARRLAALDGSGHLDRAAEQQQFLGERGLARVRMRNDRKGTAPQDFRCERHCVRGRRMTRASSRPTAAW